MDITLELVRALAKRIGARPDYPMWAPPEHVRDLHRVLDLIEGPLLPHPQSNVDVDAVVRRVMEQTKAARAYLARS